MSETTENTRVDRRKERSWWHTEACQMKRDGVALKDIAAKFGRKVRAVDRATRGVKTKHGERRNRGEVAGFKMGTCRRVAISFTDEQIALINAYAMEEGFSFSLAVSKLVDKATQPVDLMMAAE